MPEIKQTISVSRGKTAIEHDLREHTPNNVDASMSKYNVVLINELGGKSLAEYTNEYMKPYIEEYNKKQRRSDRKKSYDYASDYTEEQNHMQTSRQNYTAGQLAYEYVIQFGDHNSLDVNEVIADKYLYEDTVEMFREFIDNYQESYPHMKIVLATVHMDEPKGTPHMHILVQPIGEGYKQGLSHQISLTKALACDGFERSDVRKERLSLTRWQDDMKDNIMEPILGRHMYVREYKDGEKHHMPVALYKKTMEEKDAILLDAFHEADSITYEAKSSSKQIIENAEEKAKKLIREAEEEVDDIMDEKNTLINGKGLAWGANTPYEDWPMEALKQEREFFLEGTPGETDVDNMSLPQLKLEYNKWGKKYDKLVDGYDRADGTHILGYNELVKRHKELMEEPARLLQTDAGKKIIDDAKEEIVQTVYQKIMHDIMGFVETYIFGSIKRHLVEPLYKAIDEMMYGHSFKLNDNDRKILKRAINSSVDEVTEEYSIGKRIEENVRDNMPSISLIEKEVQEQIQRRPRMHR